MPSKKRLCVPGEIHYIYAKSISEVLLFNNESDKDIFLSMLKDDLKRTGFECLKYDLCAQFYKLVVKINHLPLSALFRRLNSRYALTYNKIHHREGHLFKGRFKSAVLDEDYRSDILVHLSSNKSWQSDFQSSQNENSPYENSSTQFPQDPSDTPLNNTDHNRISQNNIDNIHIEKQNRYDPKCWGIGGIPFLKKAMSDLQSEFKLVANYTLTNWNLSKVRDFILARTTVTLFDFQNRGRLNKQSSARKLFAFFTTKILNFRIADVAKFLKVSSTAISKLAQKGYFIAEELCITLPENPEFIPELV